jgi:hypothetical protein
MTMTRKVTSLACLALLVMGVAALQVPIARAAAPAPGLYQSTDLGGVLSTGRYTEGWFAGGGALEAGTTQNCGSWNGAALGTEWKYTCGTQVADGVVTFDAVDGFGNGNRTTRCTYTGGVFWLSGSGPWANGDASYPGHFDSYVEYETVQYMGGVPVAAVTNVQTTAHFDAYPAQCMSFSIANGSRVGTTDLGNVMPPNFPDLLDPGCNPTATLGAWWNMNSLTISITPGCVTPTRASTWGSLKAAYR